MRSKLFVPGSRPELFDKALSGPADGLSFDLEDSVTEGRKAEARDAIRTLLLRPAAVASGKTLIVRVNALGTAHFAADVAAVVQPGLQLLNLPKTETVSEVLAAVQALEAAEHSNGVTAPVRLLLNIESPRGLRQAHALACAHPRVAGLQLGLGDLFEPLQIDRHNPAALVPIWLQLRLAAGEAGIFAYDGAYARFSDADGFQAEAQAARRFGFMGKSCIHPSQVALANAVFQPTPEEIAQAQRTVRAATAAEANHTGAYVVDGAMVDAPFVKRARQLLADAHRYGLTTDTNGDSK